MIGHNGWYYLFTSWDRCCMGLQSTYRIVVGRSSLDHGALRRPHRTLPHGRRRHAVLASMSNQVGPGGESIAGGAIAYHYYDATAGGVPRLGMRALNWTADGWPQLTAAPPLATAAKPQV